MIQPKYQDQALAFRRFEEMPVWQDARKLTRAIYTITQGSKFCRDSGLSGQIRRASVSVMSNIAEGYERRSRKEFLQFLSIAKGSVGEVRCQLYVALDLGYITAEEAKDLFDLCVAISVQISKFSRYLVGKAAPEAHA